jgi:hypothetical protein
MPSRSAAPSGALLRERQSRQVRRARALLRLSLAAAATAVVCVGVAIVATWTHTPDTATLGKLLVVTSGGGRRTVCGTLDDKTTTGLVIRRKGMPLVRLKSSEIASMTSVPSCPAGVKALIDANGRR